MLDYDKNCSDYILPNGKTISTMGNDYWICPTENYPVWMSKEED